MAGTDGRTSPDGVRARQVTAILPTPSSSDRRVRPPRAGRRVRTDGDTRTLVRHLSYFITLAREKHFARAAEACNVAQPTLSAAIRKLEEDLRVPLVVRGHSFLGLTAESETVLAWGRQILTDYESLRADLSGLRQELW